MNRQNTSTRASQIQEHIVFVLEFFYPHVGGLETLFQHLAEGLARTGRRVTVVTLWIPGTTTYELHNNVEIIRVKTPPFAQRYLFMLWALPMVLRYTRRADLIHTTTYNAALPAWIASVKHKIPAVITVHEVFGEQWNQLPQLNPLLGSIFRFVEWTILHLRFQHYICDSDFTAHRLQRIMNVKSEKVSTVYPAVDYQFWDSTLHTMRDLRQQLQIDPAASLYLYFGRAGISKGLEYLIRAARIVHARNPRSRGVLLLAQDPRRPFQRIIELIHEYHLNDYIHVLEPVPRAELPSYLLAADCIIVPSISEGFGYAAVEAATIGCPVITTTGHSVEEVLADRATFVAPRNPEALAEAILLGFAHRPVWQRPKKYDIDSHIQGVVDIYRQLETER